MLTVLGADGPSRHQQPVTVGCYHGVGVDDAEVDTRDPVLIGCVAGRVGGDREFRGDLDPEPALIEDQGTDRIAAAGYGTTRSSRTSSGGRPAAVGRRSDRPSRWKVP
jgi:hypothetical protein